MNKSVSKLEAELADCLDQDRYEALHAAFDKFADQAAYITAGLPEYTWELEDFCPETDKWLNKMFRALNRLESDHRGIFDW